MGLLAHLRAVSLIRPSAPALEIAPFRGWGYSPFCMTHADLAQKIRALDGLNPAEKSALLDLLHHPKRYGLVWEEKPEAVEELLRASLPVLLEVPERRIVAQPAPSAAPAPKPTAQPSLDFGTEPADEPTPSTTLAPHHLLIEGDNLHALTALSYTHAGRVDVIYIDPPYNTGNRDFKYNDRFVDREDAYRHSKWLSFMAKRLRLARTLLADTGVIFISIDDNEQAQLKLLCDEVFGEENFVANVIWEKSYAPKSSAKFLSDRHEYVSIFQKGNWQINPLPRSEKQDKAYSNPDNDPRGAWRPNNLAARNFYSLGTYSIMCPSGRIIEGPPKGSYWRFSEKKFWELDADRRIWWGRDGNGVPAPKIFLSEVKQGITPETIWPYGEVGHSQEAKKEILAIFGEDEGFFTTPKPVKLLNRILQLSTQKSSLVLDFFAGSGTTLHAVMALNAEDGGTRQCMLVTNNESNIAEEVCYERNRRVIAGYTKPNRGDGPGERVPGLTHNHLHYYRTGFVGRERSLANKRALVRAATDLLCVKEGCFEPHSFEGAGSDLRLFTNGTGGAFLVVYDDAALDEAVALVQRLAGAPDRPRRLSVYVFAPGSYPYTDDFEDVLTADFPIRVTLCALPEAIYRAWQHLLPPPGLPQPVDEEEIRPALRDELTGTPEGGGA